MDVFISYASEDKLAVAQPLADLLMQQDVDVWYDGYSLKAGDSLRREIDRALAGCRYGVVILSESFFAKEWPQRELDGLATREVGGSKVIIPVWHNVTCDQVARYSPTLADRVAITTDKGLEILAQQIVRVVCPKPKRTTRSWGLSSEDRQLFVGGCRI
jgi:TIR domain-containing protein